MKLSREDILHIATLARLGVTAADIENFQEQLSNILENFEVLRQVDTTNVPPTAQSIDLNTIMKDDSARPSLPGEETLANAPRREGDFFRVRAVLE